VVCPAFLHPHSRKLAASLLPSLIPSPDRCLEDGWHSDSSSKSTCLASIRPKPQCHKKRKEKTSQELWHAPAIPASGEAEGEDREGEDREFEACLDSIARPCLIKKKKKRKKEKEKSKAEKDKD
jgi:hypothetical protein